jgi:hypothetical protein
VLVVVRAEDVVVGLDRGIELELDVGLD